MGSLGRQSELPRTRGVKNWINILTDFDSSPSGDDCMSDRRRCYIAGFLHGVAALLIAGWTLGHWMPIKFGAFGATGIFSVVLAPGFIVMGGLLSGLRVNRLKPPQTH
jgi:hypothetical protein